MMLERLPELEREFDDVEARLADPELLADQQRYQEVAKRYSELEQLVSRARELRQRTEDLETAKEMLSGLDGDDREVMRTEVSEAETDIERLEDELRLLLLPKDPNVGKNVIVEIRGAEGGEEANLFARDLYDMYAAYAGRMGWKLELLGSDPSDMGGFNDVTFLLKGEGVWPRMHQEGGPHRVQRVPVTESQGRIHTSSATVTVLPEAEEVEVAIDPNDLQVDVYRSSGPGGQSVNTTDSAVRITHKPTGLVVAMQDEKSQIQNRAKAMQVLRSRLLKLKQDEQAAELSDARKGQVGGGGRSEKIRTYNFKENRLTDHRIGLTLYKIDKVLAGELDDVIDALVAAEQTDRLRFSEGA
jgi:peptide chain release factor 1